jgi:hypothetical protein
MFIKWLRVKRRMHAMTLKDLVRNGPSALKEGAVIAMSTLDRAISRSREAAILNRAAKLAVADDKQIDQRV